MGVKLSRRITSDLESKIQWLLQNNPSLTEEQLRTYAEADPGKGTYLQWILKQVQQNQIRLPEDQQRIFNLLKYFNNNKNKKDWTISKDINQLNFHQLEDYVDSLHGEDLKSKQQEIKEVKEKGAEKVYDQDNYQVIKVTSAEAACIYSKETKWCTSNPETAQEYLLNGLLYVILKDNKKIAQFHVRSDQLMDVKDRKIDVSKQPKEFQEAIINGVFGGINKLKQDPENAYWYVHNVLKGRFPEAEPAIAKDPGSAYQYAVNILNGRFPEAEPAIAKNPYYAVRYAEYVLEGPFPEAEPVIAKDSYYAYAYARKILNGPFPEAEPAIAKNPYYAYAYARKILNGPFPEAEPAIAKNPYYAWLYARYVLKGPFPEGEPAIAKDPGNAYWYAVNILKDSNPETWAERYTKKNNTRGILDMLINKPKFEEIVQGSNIRLLTEKNATRYDNVSLVLGKGSILSVLQASNGNVEVFTVKATDSVGNRHADHQVVSFNIKQGEFDLEGKEDENVTADDLAGDVLDQFPDPSQDQVWEYAGLYPNISADELWSAVQKKLRERGTISAKHKQTEQFLTAALASDWDDYYEEANNIISQATEDLTAKQVATKLMRKFPELSMTDAVAVAERSLSFVMASVVKYAYFQEGLEYLGVDDWFHYFANSDGEVYYYVSEVAPWWADIIEEYAGVPFNEVMDDYDQIEEVQQRAREDGREGREVVNLVSQRGTSVLKRDPEADQHLESLRTLPKYGVPAKVPESGLFSQNSKRTAYFQVGDMIRPQDDPDAKPMKIEEEKIDAEADGGRSAGRHMYKVKGLGWITDVEIEQYQKVGNEDYTTNIYKDKQRYDDPSDHGFDGEARPKVKASKRLSRKDLLPGGEGDELQPEDVDPEQLQKGIEVEMEHTGDIKIAKEIALDHLAEYPDYYTRLEKVESSKLKKLSRKEPEADLHFANSLFSAPAYKDPFQ